MGLREDLLRGIYAYGFEKPSAIQQRAIMPVIKGRDTIAQAQSGTGKTGTFAVGILQSIDTSLRECQVRKGMVGVVVVATTNHSPPPFPFPFPSILLPGTRVGPNSRVGSADPEGHDRHR